MKKLFDRIITVTLNPALDVTLWISSMDFSEPNKATDEKLYAGGKGINISRVLASLGEDSLSVGIVGEDNKKVFTDLLNADGVRHELVSVPGLVRENITLVIPDKRVLKINRNGCAASREAMEAVKKSILAEAEAYDSVLIVFAGSLPPNVTPEAYKAFILSLKQEHVKIAVDTSIFKAEDIEEIRPWLIKPNLPEFRQMCGTNLPTEQSIVKSAQKMTEFVDHVMISLGGKGLLYADTERVVRLLPPSVAVQSTVGAGDTTLAAFIYALQQGKDPAEAAAYASAAGTASVTLDGTGVITPEQVDEILGRMTVKNVK